MLYFDSDYMRGACQPIMDRLVATNLEQTRGYGSDPYTERAKRLILRACDLEQGGSVSLLVGGTQTNATVIDGILRNYEGVIAAHTAHINVHEAGAIEASGHKVLTLPSADGKLTAAQVDDYVREFYADETFDHMVIPGMVYITQPTEFGGLYSLEELTLLSKVCRKWGIPLYVDGARLAYALGAEANDVSLGELARLADVFYIGGTKCGALFGEAVVTSRPEMMPHFFTVVKQHGALFSKGRILGLQFETLFTDGLYSQLGQSAVRMALKLRDGFEAKGYRMLLPSPTNQQFPVLPNEVMDSLKEVASFEVWGVRGEKETTVRFVTDWATTEADIDQLIAHLPQNPNL